MRAGRLGAFRRELGHETQFLGVIRPGEPAGEMSLIAEAPHSADVVALRDSEIIAVPRDTFFEACEADTAKSLIWVMVEVTTAYGTIPFKVSRLAGRIVTVTPEFADVARIAREKSLPVREVLDQARADGRRLLGE